MCLFRTFSPRLENNDTLKCTSDSFAHTLKYVVNVENCHNYTCCSYTSSLLYALLPCYPCQPGIQADCSSCRPPILLLLLLQLPSPHPAAAPAPVPPSCCYLSAVGQPALHQIVMHYALHLTTLHCTALHCTALYLHCTSLQCTAFVIFYCTLAILHTARLVCVLLEQM